MSDRLLYRIALTQIPKVGVMLAKNLISYCGGAKEVYQKTKKELCRIPGIGASLAEKIIRGEGLKKAEEELHFIEKHKIQALFYLDEDYPQRLKHYHDCPVLLYHKGNAALNASRVVAIVGTRTPTTNGILNTEDLINGLEAYGALVVSGLAYGIDVTAHRKCLELEMPNIGVLGHGLSKIYPNAHQSIAQRMTENGGLLTEFVSSTGIEREHFPMRNRIIAGMCDALVVAETAKKGGSMISAQMANNYSKDVFAFPGRTKDKMSEGCNRLIKTHKASLIESIDDLAYIMRWDKEQECVDRQARLFESLSSNEQQIVNLLQEKEDLSIDSLTWQTQLPSNKVSALLLELEFRGIIKTLPGKRYVLS